MTLSPPPYSLVQPGNFSATAAGLPGHCRAATTPLSIGVPGRVSGLSMWPPRRIPTSGGPDRQELARRTGQHVSTSPLGPNSERLCRAC